jgi:hypothetical protein
MSFKTAVTNSLLMFVAATCVVLIVKALPQTQLAMQVAANSNTGTNGSAVQNNSGTPTPAMRDGVKVCYFHTNTRCTTCRNIEAYAKEAVETGFADELKNGKIQWQVINYESPGNEHYATDYQIAAPNVVLVKFKNGKQDSWKGLPEVWEHVGDKAAFVDFVQKNLRGFIDGSNTAGLSDSQPAPTSDESRNASLPLPLPE